MRWSTSCTQLLSCCSVYGRWVMHASACFCCACQLCLLCCLPDAAIVSFGSKLLAWLNVSPHSASSKGHSSIALKPWGLSACNSCVRSKCHTIKRAFMQLPALLRRWAPANPGTCNRCAWPVRCLAGGAVESVPGVQPGAHGAHRIQVGRPACSARVICKQRFAVLQEASNHQSGDCPGCASLRLQSIQALHAAHSTCWAVRRGDVGRPSSDCRDHASLMSLYDMHAGRSVLGAGASRCLVATR